MFNRVMMMFKVFSCIQAWAEANQQRLLREGAPLSAASLAVARQAGVARPELVRVLVVDAMPPLPDEVLASGLAPRSQLERLQQAAGLTLGHGIFILQGCQDQTIVLAHELAHVAQYERLGGIGPFLQQYLAEIAAHGYENAALEAEANRIANAIVLPPSALPS